MEISESLDVLDDLTINLNGHTITYEGSSDQLFNVTGPATLTINGKVDGSAISSSKIIATATNINSNIIINGGEHTTAGPTVYKTSGGEISIKNGEFKATAENYMNTLVGNRDHISVSGGSFFNWNPATTNSEGKNFMAVLENPEKESFKINEVKIMPESEESDIWYIVKKSYIATSKDDISNAWNDEDVDEIIFNDEISNTDNIISFDRDVTIDMKDYLFEGYAPLGQGGVPSIGINGQYELTIKNGNLKGRGIFAYFGAYIEIDGGK